MAVARPATSRREGYKPAVSAADSLAHRLASLTAFRRARREEMLSARRQAPEDGRLCRADDEDGGVECPWSTEEFAVWLAAMDAASLSMARALTNVRAMRSLVQLGSSRVLKAVVDAGVVSTLGRLLECPDDEVSLEAAICLTNISSGSYELSGAVMAYAPSLLALASRDGPAHVEQAVLAIANIAGECEEYRAALVDNGAIPPVVAAMGSRIGSVAACAAWAICALLKGAESAVPFVDAGVVDPIVRCLRATPVNETVACEMLWALTYVTAREEDVCCAIVDTNDVLSLVIPCLLAEELGCAALRLIGNCVALLERYSRLCLEHREFIPALRTLLAGEGRGDLSLPRTIGEAAWVTGNLASVGPVFARALHAEGVLDLCVVLASTAPFIVMREAVFAVFNFALVDDLLDTIVSRSPVMSAFKSLLNKPQMELVGLALSFFSRVMRDHPEGVRLVRSVGADDALDETQYRLQGTFEGNSAGELVRVFLEAEDDEVEA